MKKKILALFCASAMLIVSGCAGNENSESTQTSATDDTTVTDIADTVTEEEILSSCTNAFAGGWNNVKLYFMLGLPTETDEDVIGIAELVYKIILAWKANAVNKKRGLRVHVATAYFVPKPHTPFQWEKQITPEEYLRRCKLLKSHLSITTTLRI